MFVEPVHLGYDVTKSAPRASARRSLYHIEEPWLAHEATAPKARRRAASAANQSRVRPCNKRCHKRGAGSRHSTAGVHGRHLQDPCSLQCLSRKRPAAAGRSSESRRRAARAPPRCSRETPMTTSADTRCAPLDCVVVGDHRDVRVAELELAGEVTLGCPVMLIACQPICPSQCDSGSGPNGYLDHHDLPRSRTGMSSSVAVRNKDAAEVRRNTDPWPRHVSSRGRRRGGLRVPRCGRRTGRRQRTSLSPSGWSAPEAHGPIRPRNRAPASPRDRPVPPAAAHAGARVAVGTRLAYRRLRRRRAARSVGRTGVPIVTSSASSRNEYNPSCLKR